jgi:hypothetical protein
VNGACEGFDQHEVEIKGLVIPNLQRPMQTTKIMMSFLLPIKLRVNQ